MNTGLFVSYKDYDRSMPAINQQFAALFNRYRADAQKNGAGFVAVIHNTPTEIKFTGIDIIKTNNRSLNQLADSLTGLGIRCFNLSAPLRQQFQSIPMEQLSYPHDFHYTPMAYAFIGKIISDSLLVNGIVKP